MILDTNALSAFVDGEPGIGSILRLQARVAIPVIVLGEFRYGIAGSKHHKKYEHWLDTFLGDFDLLSITPETALPYASLRLHLRRAGRPIPTNDTWIAALAVQYRLPVLSRDNHFGDLPRVRRVDW